MWLALNITSTLISLYSIHKLFETIKELRQSNSNVEFNKWTLVFHSTFLICAVLANTIDVVTSALDIANMLIYCIVIIIDAILQLAICYICWTMGSDQHLRQFKCYIVKDVYGNLQVHYELAV